MGIGILLTWLLGNALVDLCPMSVRFPEGAYVLDNAPTGSRSPVAITFGSSRFRCGLYADELGSIAAERLGYGQPVRVYSGAVPAGNPVTFELLMSGLLAEGCRPKFVIAEISPETVGRYAPWLGFDVLRHLDFLHAVGALPDAYRSRSQARVISSRLVPVYRHNIHLRQWAARVMGFDWQDSTLARLSFPNLIEKRMAGLRDPAMARWFRNYQVGGIQPRSFERLLALCRENGVHVILVGVPVSTPHQALYAGSVGSQYRQFVDSLVARYGCSFVDMSTRIADDDFADHHHLLASGGHRFTRLVAEEVLVPAVRKLLAAPAAATAP